MRVDQSPDGVLSSSFFNYANISDTGLVDNTLTTYSPDSDVLEVWRDYVNSNFPIFPEDILVASGAVFTGLVERTQVGKVAGVCCTQFHPPDILTFLWYRCYLYMANETTVELDVSRRHPGHRLCEQLPRRCRVRLLLS